MSETPPLDQRSKRRLARAGIPQCIVRRDQASQPATALLPADIAAESQSDTATHRMTTTPDSSDDSDEDDAPRTITTSVFVHTHGGELAKRPRPSTSTSGCSDEQEDKRVKLTRPALALAIPTDSPRSPTPLISRMHEVERETTCASPPPAMFRSQSETQESASWPKNSTSYAGLASPIHLEDVQMQPVSPQPGTTYAAAAAAPASTGRMPQPTVTPAPPTDPAPRSSYPPLVVERLPNWTRHFQALGGILGHAPNARPFGGGVRFLPKSAEEFRSVQRYLTTAAAQDSAISWYCYSPANEIPIKVAIRGLLLDTPTEAVVAALRERGFPAEAARAIPPPRGKHGCTYFVRLAHITQEELRDLYSITELLYMPQVTVEAWRGGNKPPQCFRCQLYSHSSANCHRPIRCVRCAGEHAVKDCPRPREETPTCVNCGQGHAANDRRCTFYKKEARRRGIAQPPLPPRAKQRQRQQQRATNAPAEPDAPPTTHQMRETRSSTAADPNTASRATEPRTADQPNTMPTAAPPAASTFGFTNRNPTEPTVTRPTTLVADANPPTIHRSVSCGKKRKRKRAPRPANTEPAAASTPQQRQPRAEEKNGVSCGPSATSTTGPTTSRQTVPVSRASPSAPPGHQTTQGEAQTNPDVMAIVRVVVEALMTGLTAYLQGQGALPALAAGMAVLTRLHSC